LASHNLKLSHSRQSSHTSSLSHSVKGSHNLALSHNQQKSHSTAISSGTKHLLVVSRGNTHGIVVSKAVQHSTVASKGMTNNKGNVPKVIRNIPSKIDKGLVKKANPSQQTTNKSTERKIIKKEPVRRVHNVNASKEARKKGN
jgi:hypothetical protein